MVVQFKACQKNVLLTIFHFTVNSVAISEVIQFLNLLCLSADHVFKI
jgi:hypothetical protein